MQITTSKRERFLAKIDLYLAILGFVLSLGMAIWLQTNFQKYAEVAIILMLACATYAAVRQQNLPLQVRGESNQARAWAIYGWLNFAFVLLFLYTLIVILNRPDIYVRPLGYFIGTAMIVVVLALEIIIMPERKACEVWLLIKIGIVSLSIITIPQVMYPGLAGVDPWAHQMMTFDLLRNGSMPAGYEYSKLPIMHLLIAATSLTTGLDYKYASLFSVDFLQFFAVVFVFLVARYIFNARVGLLAALLLATGAIWIPWSMGAVPAAMAVSLVALLVYLIITGGSGKSVTKAILIIVIIATLVMTHTITTLCMVIVLFIFWIGFQIRNLIFGEKYQTLATFSLAVFSLIAMLGWWTYVSGDMQSLREIIQRGFRVDEWDVSAIHASYKQLIPLSEYLMGLAGFLLFYAYSIIGTFYIVGKKSGRGMSFALVLAGLALVLIGFISLPLKITGFLAHRWWYYSYLIMAIPTALGVFLIIYRFKTKAMQMMALIIIVGMLSFFSVTAPEANFDNRIYSKNSGIRYSFKASELEGMTTISQIWPGTVGTVTAPENYFFAYGEGKSVIDTAESFYKRDFKAVEKTIIIVTDELTKDVPDIIGGQFKLDYDPREELERQGFDRIYDNPAASGYIKSSTSIP